MAVVTCYTAVVQLFYNSFDVVLVVLCCFRVSVSCLLVWLFKGFFFLFLVIVKR